MHYEINVAKIDHRRHYMHLFATHERSLPTRAEAREVYERLVRAFPEPQFHVTVVQKENTSRQLDPVRDLAG